MIYKVLIQCVATLFTVAPAVFAADLSWPIDCKPGDGICSARIGYPDIDDNGVAFNCESPGYTGHQGTDISLTSWDKMNAGVSVFAAADGEVLWVYDGKYDRCPNPDEPDCQPPPSNWFQQGQTNGYRVCTELGNYCSSGTCCCYWCFDGGNVVVIRHTDVEGVFASRYDHLKTNSITVTAGEIVKKGQKIAEVGSSGHSTGPHLHFETWGTGFYELSEPWAGTCGPNKLSPLWKDNPPWKIMGYGDINYDGVINLTDIIITLKIVTEQTPTVNISSIADVNDDGMINTAEAIYIMQNLTAP